VVCNTIISTTIPVTTTVKSTHNKALLDVWKPDGTIVQVVASYQSPGVMDDFFFYFWPSKNEFYVFDGSYCKSWFRIPLSKGFLLEPDSTRTQIWDEKLPIIIQFGSSVRFNKEYYLVKDKTTDKPTGKGILVCKGKILDDISSEGYISEYLGYKIKVDHYFT